jgi:hypothetical protein
LSHHFNFYTRQFVKFCYAVTTGCFFNEFFFCFNTNLINLINLLKINQFFYYIELYWIISKISNHRNCNLSFILAFSGYFDKLMFCKHSNKKIRCEKISKNTTNMGNINWIFESTRHRYKYFYLILSVYVVEFYSNTAIIHKFNNSIMQ